MAKRSATVQYHPNKYSVVGGYLNTSDADIMTTLRREVAEEASLELQPARISLAKNLLRLVHFPAYVTPDQGPHHHLIFQFALELHDDEYHQLAAADETSGLSWLSLDEITTLNNAGQLAYPHEYEQFNLAFAWLKQQ